MTDETDDVVLLTPAVDPEPELADHPEALTSTEEAEGFAAWQAVDDRDDASNGIDPPGLRTASRGYAEAMRRARIVRDCLLEAGVPEVSIEIQDGRPGSGDTWNLLDPVAVYSHHIASNPTSTNPVPGLALVKRGRPGLDGPLANGAAGVDLVYRILCLGMANHPGEGGPLTVRGPLGAFTIPRNVARPYAWGTEYEGGYSEAVWDRTYTNKRTGISMTFREFMGRANAGLTRAIWLINSHGKNPGEAGELDLSGYHGEHKTWAPGRKPDRLGYSTETGRAEVRKYNEGDDDVAAKDVWAFPIRVLGTETRIKASSMLAQAHRRAGNANKAAQAAVKNSASALRQAQANRAAIAEIAKTLDPASSKRVAAALGPEPTDVEVRIEDVDLIEDEVEQA